MVTLIIVDQIAHILNLTANYTIEKHKMNRYKHIQVTRYTLKYKTNVTNNYNSFYKRYSLYKMFTHSHRFLETGQILRSKNPCIEA